ncbi:MAG: DUF5655 domain-containing protein, partial [Chloroflexota bacterium]
KTGKSPEDFIRLAKEKGLTKHADLLAWLKNDFGLGHGHATAVIHVITSVDAPQETDDQGIAKHFTGAKAAWRKPYDDLIAKLNGFGGDVRVAPTSTYLSLLRGDKKFGIVQISGKRIDLGIKLKGAPFEGRFQDGSAWNAMVTHRVQITDPNQLDSDVISWLRQAYDKA